MTFELEYVLNIGMARCAYCKANETRLFEDGSPICLSCASLPDYGRGIQAVLVKALSEATQGADSVFAELTAIMSDIPSGMPHPDGVQRIHNTSDKLALARLELNEAHARLNAYLERGIVPEDLKGSGEIRFSRSNGISAGAGTIGTAIGTRR